MILAALVHLTLQANCEYALSTKWERFKREHIIDWDREDPQTREYLERLEREKEENDETHKH